MHAACNIQTDMRVLPTAASSAGDGTLLSSRRTHRPRKATPMCMRSRHFSSRKFSIQREQHQIISPRDRAAELNLHSARSDLVERKGRKNKRCRIVGSRSTVIIPLHPRQCQVLPRSAHRNPHFVQFCEWSHLRTKPRLRKHPTSDFAVSPRPAIES